MSSCPHLVVFWESDTVLLFGEKTMPLDRWFCTVCSWEFMPRQRTLSEKIAEWREVRRFARSIRKARFEE